MDLKEKERTDIPRLVNGIFCPELRLGRKHHSLKFEPRNRHITAKDQGICLSQRSFHEGLVYWEFELQKSADMGSVVCGLAVKGVDLSANLGADHQPLGCVAWWIDSFGSCVYTPQTEERSWTVTGRTPQGGRAGFLLDFNTKNLGLVA